MIKKPSDKLLQYFCNQVNSVSPLNDSCWALLLPMVYAKRIDENVFFSKEGDYVKEIGLVYSGLLRIFYLKEDGKEWNKHFLLKKDFVASCISPDKKSVTNIQALEDSLLLCIPYIEVMKLAETFPELNVFIQNLMFSYIQQKQERELSLLTGDAQSNYESFRRRYPDLENKIKHYHIASYLGITPTQLSRIRKSGNFHTQ